MMQTIAQTCTGTQVLSFPQFTSEHEGNGNQKYTHDIVCFLDTSGSTNNNGMRRGTRFDCSDSDSEPKTKIIIAAECEGIVTVMMEYMRRYNMNGVSFSLILFSSSYNIQKFEIESNRSFYELLTKIGDLEYEGSGTNLLTPLKHVFNAESVYKPLDIIIATDGQPENKSETVKLLTNIHIPFSLFVIGAGSISDSTKESLILNRDDRIHGRFTQLAKGMGSECDLKYLMDLITLSNSNNSGYCGAFKDYSDLKVAINKYLDNQDKIGDIYGYSVKLDDGWTSLPWEVNTELNNGNFVLAKTKYGHYLYNQNWQLAIADNSDCSSDLPQFYGTKVITVNDHEITQQTNLTDMCQLIDSNTVITISDFMISPALTDRGFARIRHVKSN